MSRETRNQYHDRIDHAPKPKKYSYGSTVAYLARIIKRVIKSKDRARIYKKYEFTYDLDGVTGMVLAQNRCEARTLIKYDLGISVKERLPVSIIINRGLNVENK